jgi:ABC-type polar amino acid transport system ATPase subunit
MLIVIYQAQILDLLREMRIGHVAETMGYALSGGERRRAEIARALGIAGILAALSDIKIAQLVNEMTPGQGADVLSTVESGYEVTHPIVYFVMGPKGWTREHWPPTTRFSCKS